MKYPAPAPLLKDARDQVETRKAFADLCRVLERNIVGEKTGSDPSRGRYVEYTEGPNAQEAVAPGTIPIRDESGALSGTLAGSPKDPTGFLDPESVIVSYDSTASKISLSGSVSAFWRGVRVPEIAPGWVSPALTGFYAAPAGTYFLYYDGAQYLWSSTPWNFDMLQIATVTYSAAGSYLFASRECHGVMPFQTHEEFHRTIGTYRKSGGAVSAIVIGSTTAGERRPAIAATVLADEDLETTDPALAAGSYTHEYLAGAGAVNTFALAAGDIVPLSGARPYYNQYTGGAWQQTLMAASNYMTVWLVAIPTTSDAGAQAYRYIWIQGQTEGSLSNQQALTPANLTLGTLVTLAPEFVFIARFIIRYIGGDWNIAQADMIASGRFIQVTAANSSELDGYTYAELVTAMKLELHPVGSFYTQYPDADSNTEATEFPSTLRPDTLFGGTWVEQWPTESIYFRTRGTPSDSGRVNGSQPDAFQGHKHGRVDGTSTRHSVNNGFSAGANSIPWSNVGSNQADALNSDGVNGTPRAAAETRVINRRIKVWKRTS